MAKYNLCDIVFKEAAVPGNYTWGRDDVYQLWTLQRELANQSALNGSRGWRGIFAGLRGFDSVAWFSLTWIFAVDGPVSY